MPPRRALLSFALVAGAVLGAGCGSGTVGGETQVPEGYTTFREAGVAFAHPEGWRVDRQPASDGGVRLVISAPDPDATPAAGITLSVLPGRGAEGFERFVEGSRVVSETRSAELVSDEEVDVEGAQAAVRSILEFPPLSGSDPVLVRTTTLDVLDSDGEIVSLSVPVPQRGGEPPVDPEVVLSTFRLER